jgi:hypothetical protein
MAGEVTLDSSHSEDKLGLRVQLGQLSLGSGAKTASATSGAATLNQPSGIVTSEALTTAAAATYTLTLTNNKVAATDIVQVTLANGTNSAGAPVLSTSTVTDSTVTVVVKNVHVSAALNGTLVFYFYLIKV